MCSGKGTNSDLCEKPVMMLCHFSGNRGISSLTHTCSWCFVKEGEVMLCACGKLWHVAWVSVIEKAEAEESRERVIAAVEKASEALREMNLAGDSVSEAQRCLPH